MKSVQFNASRVESSSTAGTTSRAVSGRLLRWSCVTGAQTPKWSHYGWDCLYLGETGKDMWVHVGCIPCFGIRTRWRWKQNHVSTSPSHLHWVGCKGLRRVWRMGADDSWGDVSLRAMGEPYFYMVKDILRRSSWETASSTQHTISGSLARIHLQKGISNCSPRRDSNTGNQRSWTCYFVYPTTLHSKHTQTQSIPEPEFHWSTRGNSVWWKSSQRCCLQWRSHKNTRTAGNRRSILLGEISPWPRSAALPLEKTQAS